MGAGDPEEWLSVAAVAKRLGMTPESARRLVARGELAGAGRPLRVRRADLETYIEASQVQPGTLAHLVPSTNRDYRPRPPRTTLEGLPDRRFRSSSEG